MKAVAAPHAPDSLFDFADFQRARDQLLEALGAEPGYGLLSGESGSGKTSLLRDLAQRLDRTRYRVVYLSHGDLSPYGLTRVLAHNLHIHPPRGHAEAIDTLGRVIAQSAGRLVLFLDEAHDLPDETFTLLRTLAEAQLDPHPLLSVLLAGLPSLRTRLSAPALFPLWRRIQQRVEINGLVADELEPYLQHLLGDDVRRFPPQALAILFERGRGLPGLIASLARIALRHASGNDPLDAQQLQTTLEQWELP